jgi:hypothetical protein
MQAPETFLTRCRQKIHFWRVKTEKNIKSYFVTQPISTLQGIMVIREGKNLITSTSPEPPGTLVVRASVEYSLLTVKETHLYSHMSPDKCYSTSCGSEVRILLPMLLPAQSSEKGPRVLL